MKRMLFSVVFLLSSSALTFANGPQWDSFTRQMKVVAQDPEVIKVAAEAHEAVLTLAHTAFRKYAEIAPAQEKQFLQMVVAFLQDLLTDLMPVFRNGKNAISNEQKEELMQKLMVAQQMVQTVGMSLAEYLQEQYSKEITITKGKKKYAAVEPDYEKLAPLYIPFIEMVKASLQGMENVLQA